MTNLIKMIKLMIGQKMTLRFLMKHCRLLSHLLAKNNLEIKYIKKQFFGELPIEPNRFLFYFVVCHILTVDLVVYIWLTPALHSNGSVSTHQDSQQVFGPTSDRKLTSIGSSGLLSPGLTWSASSSTEPMSWFLVESLSCLSVWCPTATQWKSPNVLT